MPVGSWSKDHLTARLISNGISTTLSENVDPKLKFAGSQLRLIMILALICLRRVRARKLRILVHYFGRTHNYALRASDNDMAGEQHQETTRPAILTRFSGMRDLSVVRSPQRSLSSAYVLENPAGYSA
jgi:hypothetical protein